MRTLLHLSDLNFERADDSIVEALLAAAREARPDVVVVSSGGAARRELPLLESLPSPRLVVPGRGADAPEPFYEDEEMVVASINTEHGLIGGQQLASLRGRLCTRAAGVTKIVVTHYPLELPGGGEHAPAGNTEGAGASLDALARCGADVLLAGGLDPDDAGRTARRYNADGHSTLVVRAASDAAAGDGGEPHSFNLIRVQRPHIQVERHAWRADASAFKPASSETFRHAPDGWTRLSDEVAAGITFADDTTGLQPTIPQTDD